MSVAIWWIRRDLRLADNQALQAALAAADHVIPLFIWDEAILASPWAGERRLAFLLAGLRNLDEELRSRGSRLVMRRGQPAAVLAGLANECNVTGVFAEADCSPYAKRRDAKVAEVVRLTLTPGVSIRSLDAIRTEKGSPYTVFTPYSRKWKSLGAIDASEIAPAPAALKTPDNVMGEPWPEGPPLPPANPFEPGEAEALRRLERFVSGRNAPVHGYADGRNHPALEATSQLSPYLRFGMLSPRLAAQRAYQALQEAPTKAAKAGVESWLNELIWRDFYLMILSEFPFVRWGSFRREYDGLVWANDEEHFAAWCAGRTGYPFVDAGMRQLATLGWMHNRLRMVVASFLVKHLLIDWRWGERWFMQQLVDGDPASNNGGWQWVAGVGTDAAPYFRIFNPVTQGQKFDAAGTFVRRWVPELAGAPARHLHSPWQMAPDEQWRAGCVLGKDYPLPIVDHAWARQRALAAYEAVR
jgi:deoxyribodipyrimidine photo-lyase